MATPLSATKIRNIFQASGVSYVTREGWATHNRNHRGDWGPVHGVMIHHTGPYQTERGMLDLLWSGYETLPGPLCHIAITKLGRIHMIGWGRTNHAGGGDGRVLEHVVRERMPLPAPRFANGSAGSVDGNRPFYGIELLNQGDGEDPWAPHQVRAAQRVAGVICQAHRWTERSVIGHLEWQKGKIDPKGFSMADFRAGVRRYLA